MFTRLLQWDDDDEYCDCDYPSDDDTGYCIYCGMRITWTGYQ